MQSKGQRYGDIDFIDKAIYLYGGGIGDRLSDDYIDVLDRATDTKVTKEKWKMALHRLRELQTPENDVFIKRQLQNFEFPPYIIGLVPAYESHIDQAQKLLLDHGRQQGWHVV